ncbi:MAG: DUF1465 family protein [Candidatus Devosia symbiotica]|nr:DUF1465 family protein [Candidatus Devosia symbiotica]
MAAGGFDVLYREDMVLIEDVVIYLDGDGRNDSHILSREASFVYATKSMRLMQLASSLLLQCAVNEDKITKENARSEKGEGQVFGNAIGAWRSRL